jgi:uncharacterized protein (TIGR03435 family)
MLLRILLSVSAFLPAAFGQLAFEVSSVKASERTVGGDYNNHFAYEANGIRGTHVTLRRLLAEAFRLQLSQVRGPNWLDENEYDIQAMASGPAKQEQLALMLRTLVDERFKVRHRSSTEERRVYELTVDKGGPKIRAGEPPAVGGGFPFRGDMQRFADLLAVQLSIPQGSDPTRPSVASGPPVPVLDKTGLAGTFDFMIDIKLEPGGDGFVTWQRALKEKMGLKLDSARRKVAVLIVDAAEKIPTAN